MENPTTEVGVGSHLYSPEVAVDGPGTLAKAVVGATETVPIVQVPQAAGWIFCTILHPLSAFGRGLADRTAALANKTIILPILGKFLQKTFKFFNSHALGIIAAIQFTRLAVDMASYIYRAYESVRTEQRVAQNANADAADQGNSN
ncbi:MAG: hypothetical protein LBI61_04230 [Puniceicoccales bacterium]|jgi:hypothetical protein|nr:hypothetical protein [Puniceicoccales bacterium]